MKRNKASLDGGHLIRNDQETHWEPEYFPLTVFVDKNMPDHLIVGMYDAINAWNVSTGVSVFEPVLMDFDLDLPRDCGWVAAVQKPLKTAGKWRGVEKPGTGKLCAGEVSLDVGTIHKFSAKLWIHELGHSLGLAHDHGDNRSIMYPTVFSDSPQYIMPDDAVSVRTMVLGTFVPMDADLKSQLYKYLEAL
jgi:hypothetical protein